jgi:alkylation response protein AidB-like acyl-CoA dehydrogenase
MDVLLDEQEALIKETLREFLEAECTPLQVRAAEKDASGYSQALWRKFADGGWMGLSLPADCGGQDLPLPYLALLFEELGRHIAPLPVHSTLMPALIIAKYGSEAQKQLLPAVAQGNLLLSFAIQEPGGRWSTDAIALAGQPKDGGVVLSGRKLFVTDFRNAARCLVAFRWADGANKGSLGLALVDTDASGITSQTLVPLAKDQDCDVRFDGVHVPAENILSGGVDAVNDLMDYASVFLACQMQGAARKVTEASAAYVSQRDAFGQPIGAFQAIQHLAADMLNAADGIELLSREAVWLLGANLPARVEVAQAKSFANERSLFACRSAQQMHGGIGFIADCDINLWYRKVASWGLRGGTTYEHRRLIARALLDTPENVRLGEAQRLPESVRA